MPLVQNGQHAMLTGGLGNAVAYIGLHDGDPSTTGANEISGGAPAYIRKAVTWNAAGSGQRTNNGDIVFDVPAGKTIYHVGLWSAETVGTFYGYFPVGGVAAKVGTVLASSDIITSYSHGLIDKDRVLTYDIGGGGVPTGLTEGTVYYVIAAGLTTDVFSVSTTDEGGATNVTANGVLAFQKCIPEVFASQGTLTIASGTLALDARFV